MVEGEEPQALGSAGCKGEGGGGVRKVTSLQTWPVERIRGHGKRRKSIYCPSPFWQRNGVSCGKVKVAATWSRLMASPSTRLCLSPGPHLAKGYWLTLGHIVWCFPWKCLKFWKLSVYQKTAWTLNCLKSYMFAKKKKKKSYMFAKCSADVIILRLLTCQVKPLCVSCEQVLDTEI